MSEIRNSEQKGHKYLYSEIFYGGQKLLKYLCFSRGCLYGLVKLNEPVIHFATVQLVTPSNNRFFVHFRRFCSLYNLKPITIKSVGQETVFVGRDAVLYDRLNCLNSQ